MNARDSAYFDGWYTDVIRSPVRDRIARHALGLPAEVQSTGLVGWDALAEIVDVLDLRPAETILDLACGRGGYGLEIVRRTGARLIGLDFSAVAIAEARRQSEAFGLTDRAEFRVADMARTELRSASIDVVVCMDSIQFANPVSETLHECRRVLKPGGRIALTSWQLNGNADQQVRQRVPYRDLAPELKAVGFEQIVVTKKPAWSAAERAMWLSVEDVETEGDPALYAMKDQAVRVLSIFHMQYRVFVTAVAPSGTDPADVIDVASGADCPS